MSEEYKVELGVELDESSLQAAEQRLKNIGKNTKAKVQVDVDDNGSAAKTNNRIKQIEQSARSASSSTKTFGDTLKRSLSIGSAAAITSRGIRMIEQSARNAVQAVKDIDGAITDLRMATDESYQNVSRLVQGYNQMGQAIGATTTEVTDSADAWLRQGHSIKETNTLIRDSMILSKVGQLDSADATQYLTSAMKGYGVAVEDVLGIVDKLTAVDLVSATNAGGLAEAMSRTAETANLAGVSMDKLLGYLAVTGETTQKSMSSIGESFKTIFTRMADIKADKLELIDEDGTTETLSQVETVLDNLGIKLRDSDNEFRNFGDVLDEVADGWSNYSSVQQAAISKSFAGTRQSENFKVLMENYDKARQYMETAMDSSGTAEQKFAAYLDSIEAKSKSLQAAFESLSVNTFSTEMLGRIIEASTAVLQFLDNTNLLKGALAGIAAAGAIKGITLMATGIANAAVNMNKFSAALKLVKMDNLGANEIQRLSALTVNLSQSQLKAVLSSKALSTQQRMAILTSQGMSQAEAQATLATMGLSAAEGAAAATTFSLSGAIKGLWATLMANPLILVVAGVTAAVSAYSSYKQKVEEARQASLDAGNTARDEAENITNLYNVYNEAKSAYDSNTGSKETLEGATDSLLAALGIEEAQLQRLKEEYGNLDAAINQVTYDGLKQNLSDMTAAYKAAQDEMMDAAADSMGWFSGDSITVSTHGEGKKFAEVLQKAGYLEENLPKWSTSLYTGINNYGDINSLMESYQKLLDMRESLESGIDEGLYTRNELMDSGLYIDINDKINAIKSQYEEVLDYAEKINSLAAQLQYMNYIKVNGVPETQTEFDKLKSTLDNTAESSGQFVGTTEQMQDAITNTLSDMPELAQFFDGYSDILEDVAQLTNDQLNEIKSKFANNIIADWFENLSDEDKKLVYEIGLKSDDTTLYTLTRWKTELQSMKETSQTTGEQMQSFYDILNDTGDGNFSEYVEGYTKNISNLQDALSKIDTGSLEQADKVDLAMTFPELASYVNDTDALRDAIQNLIDTSNQDMNDTIDEMIANLSESAPEAAAALEALRTAINRLSNTDGGWNFDINAEVEKFDNLYAAMKESVSATGLSSKSMKNVKSMFEDLDGYDPSKLFERTANGIHMNTTELRKLQSEYEKQKKSDIDSHLQDLIDDYNNLSKELATCTDAKERASKLSQLENLQNDITAVSDLAAQYEGLTSAYNKWIQAQSAGEEGDMYDSMRDSYEDVEKLYNEGLVGTNAFRTYVDLLSNENLSTASVDEVIAAYEKLNQTIEGTSYTAIDFLAEGSDGCLNFLHAVQDLNSNWAKMNDDGSWEINFGVGNDQEIADALGIDVEYVQSLMRKLSDYGFDINLDSAYTSLDQLGTYAEQANDKLKELGKTEIEFNFNTTSIDDVNSQITEAQTLLDTFKNTDGTVNTSLEGATEAEAVLIALITRKQELSAPSVMSVDTTNANSNIETTIGLLKDFQTNYNDIEIETAVGADTSEAQTNIQNVLTSINSMPDEVKTSLGLDDTDFQTALTTLTATPVDVKAGVNLDPTALATVQSTISAITPEMMVKAGLDSSLVEGYEPPDKSNEVKYTVDDSAVRNYSAPKKTGTVQYNAYMNSWSAPTKYGTVIYTVKTVGNGKANGTAYANGTTGIAFKKGDWGTKESGVALGGEEGQELIVRDGRFFTIGDDSAEFFKYQKGDIIFNADQTEQIFEKGKISHGSKRGTSYAYGTATGRAFSRGSGTITSSGKSKTQGNKHSSSNSGGSSKKSSGGSSSSSDKEFEETFDWIEVAIDRIERAISKLDTKANSVYKTWSTRNKNLTKEMTKISEEINLQQAAYTRYMQQANSVGLSTEWMDKVKNGLVDINTITDEGLAEKIKEAQEWIDKAKDCEDVIVDLQETLSELYATAFENVSTQYDGILAVVEHEQSMIEEYISQAEEKGYITSTKYYEALMENERESISKLQKEKADLTAAMNNAVNSGTVKKGSEEWYNMVQAIDEVTLAIEEGNTALIEYAAAIREIKWEIFDLIQEKISAVTTEAQFFIDLLSSADLYNDKGQLTNEGQSTMGLHAVNYNTYMAQADDYAKEIQEIDKQLANDPANEEIAKRRQELLELQQEMILAAEDEKEAIVDMVKEGIELELDALQDLIDTYTDALDAQKSLYDYQNKIKDQTSEIAMLQKQIKAYDGDTSEETKATVQKLKVSLEKAEKNLQESEYDKYISDQKALLDKLYLDYETTLNMRLDNIDKLISDMINSVNANSGTIANTIYSAANKVGYTMSESMDTIWKQAQASTQRDAQLRVQQATAILNQLVSNGQISKYDANQILSALGSGDAAQAQQALNIIQQLIADGSITQVTGNSIIASLNTNSQKEALNALSIINKLTENGTLSTADANKIISALVTGDMQDLQNTASIISRLLANNQIDTQNAATLLSALNGNTAMENANTLSLINRLVQNSILSTADANKLWTALITGNSQDLANTTSIISRLLANQQISSDEAANLIATLNGAKAADLQNALSIINKLTENGTLSTADANKIISALVTGDAAAVQNAQSIISKLESQGKISSDDASGLKTALNTAMTNAQSANTNIVTAYGKDLGSKLTTVNTSLSNIKASVDAILAKLNGQAAQKTQAAASSSAATPTPAPAPAPAPKPTPAPAPAPAKTTTKTTTPTRTKKQKYGVALAIWNGNYGWGTGDTRKKRLKAKGFDATEIQNIVNQMGKDGYVKSGAWVGKYEGIRDLSPYHYNKFAHGIKGINRNQFAITQENGVEFINSPTLGMLTPLTQGSDVFNAAASENLWNAGNNPEQYVRDSLGLRENVSNVPVVGGSNSSNVTVNFENITLPNVKNYEEFMNTMIRDKKFESAVRNMTVDSVFGKSDLNKYSKKW